MSEISQFHKLARLVKRMDKEVSISSDAIVALSEEIAEAKALADYFRGRCYHWIQITKKWRRECKDAEALATRRKELLRECEWVKFGPTVICPVCKSTMNEFGGGHADDCKLAKELADD